MLRSYQFVSRRIAFVSQCIRYESCRAGIKPKGVKNFTQLAGICQAVYKVEMSVVPGACIQCTANPFKLLCCCKMSRKIGICAHILAVTHMILKSDDHEGDRLPSLNVKRMAELIFRKPDGTKRAGGRPKALKHCLQPEDDSSDEETARMALDWN